MSEEQRIEFLTESVKKAESAHSSNPDVLPVSLYGFHIKLMEALPVGSRCEELQQFIDRNNFPFAFTHPIDGHLEKLPKEHRFPFVKANGKRIADSVTFESILQVLPKENQMDLVKTRPDFVDDQHALVNLLELLHSDHHIDCVEFFANKIDNTLLIARIMEKLKCEADRRNFSQRSFTCIKNSYDLSSLLYDLSEANQLLFVDGQRALIKTSVDVRVVMERLSKNQRQPFAYSCKAMLRCSADVVCFMINMEKNERKSFALKNILLIDKKDLNDVIKMLPEADQNEFRLTHTRLKIRERLYEKAVGSVEDELCYNGSCALF